MKQTHLSKNTDKTAHDQLPRCSQKIVILNKFNKVDHLSHGLHCISIKWTENDSLQFKENHNKKSPEQKEAAPSFGKMKVERRFSDSFLEDL